MYQRLKEQREREACTMYHRHVSKARTAERERERGQVPKARGAEEDVPCTKVMYQKLEYAKSLVHKPECVCEYVQAEQLQCESESA